MDGLEILQQEEKFCSIIYGLERDMAFQKNFIAKCKEEINILRQEIEYRDIIINDLKIIAGAGMRW